MDMRVCRNWLFLLSTLQLLVWTLLPSLLLQNTYIDILENIVWGRYWQIGYDKDPFLGAWVTYAVYWLSGESMPVMYLVSQIMVLICWWAVWRLSCRIVPPLPALIAVSSLSLCYFLNLHSPEFNDNMIEMPLWALTCLYFYDAVKTQRLKSWLLVGLFAGLSSMAKYYTLMLLLAMIFFLLTQKEGRDSFRRAGFYAGLALFLAITLPNFFWLIEHDFIAINYAFSRACLTGDADTTCIAHFTKPLRFLLSVMGVAMPITAAIAGCFRKSLQQPAQFAVDAFAWRYVTVLCFAPIMFTAFFSAITGAKINHMWQTPLFNLLGLWAVLWLQPIFSGRRLVAYAICLGIAFFSLAGIYTWKVVVEVLLKQRAGYEFLPGQTIAESLNRLWRERYHTPLRYVVGRRKLSANVAVYAPDRPHPYFVMEPSCNPWIDRQMLHRQGAVLVWEIEEDGPEVPAAMRALFKTIEVQPVQELAWAVSPWAARWLTKKSLSSFKLGVALVPPTEN
jgi:4-amino-4-deoxy-L-arabinose transferase-like glycosyltransferase